MDKTYEKRAGATIDAFIEAVRCIVCEAPSEPHHEGELRRCTSCGLIFAHPLGFSDTPQRLFSRAYAGKEARAGMEMFHHRLIWRADLLRDGATAQMALAPAHHRALAYIRQELPPGQLVLDIGCGSGLFLEAARKAGYSVAGIEVAEPAVAFLNQAGYRAFHGTVEEVPEEWADPAMCTSFYVLHHLSDPVGFLQTIRRKFPKVPLILTQPYFGTNPKKLAAQDLPPRRLTIWNQEALRRALEKAGFATDVIELVPHEPYHPWLDGSLTQLYCRLRGLVPVKVRPHIIAGYLRGQHLVFGSLRKLFGNRPYLGQEHLLAIAHPVD